MSSCFVFVVLIVRYLILCLFYKFLSIHGYNFVFSLSYLHRSPASSFFGSF